MLSWTTTGPVSSAARSRICGQVRSRGCALCSSIRSNRRRSPLTTTSRTALKTWEDTMIAVVGATGNTGRAVVKELARLGQAPLCIVRNPDKAHEVLGAGARIAVAELSDRFALVQALKGASTVFVVTGHNPDMVTQQNNVLDAALEAGVQHLVRVSGSRFFVRPDSPSVIGRSHYAIEERLRASGMKWVILRPGFFMQNTFAQAPLIKNDGKMVLPFPADLPFAFIDVRDTGAVGARVLLDPAPHVGKIYEFTGAKSNFAEFADVFSDVLGREITYVAVPFEQAEQVMRTRGMPEWLIDHQRTARQIAMDGGLSGETMEPIRSIAGREPITTRQFIEDHRAVFA
ncbi:MAG: NmrA family NAD(P)-binding protein [Proteobacteria bacterium]|nr:NmrA family NAD(P)-binding protein [Pseudomonadota bacterium]